MPKHKERESDKRRIRVQKAAIGAFHRSGYAKTTLSIIAQGAKVHRPVLYDLFPDGKEELFGASLAMWVQEIIERYRREIVGFKTLKQKLVFCAEQWCVEGFKLTTQYPDALESFDLKYPAVRKMYRILAAFYAELLQQAVKQSPLDISAERLAELLVFSLRGERQIPDDIDGMRAVVRKRVV